MNTYREMLEIDGVVDSRPTETLIEKLAELRIRNLICFEELASFNTTGKFKNKHPLLRQHSKRYELENLLRTDSNAFLEEYKNTANNISRYQSFLKRATATTDDKEKWQKQLDKHEDIAYLMMDILKNFQNGQNN